MIILKTIGIFIVAVLGEVGGAYTVWRWRRFGASAALVPVGLAALFAYALIQTFQPEERFGRLYAAYAGVFLLGAMLWGWLVDGKNPDRFDVIGGAVVLAGAAIVLWGRDVFA